jgi:hypothetical protein
VGAWCPCGHAILALHSSKNFDANADTSPEGIYTQIGKQVGQVPWDKVRVVSPGADYIIIAGRGGNSFFIPNRAFSSALQRNGFMAEIDEWMKRKI